MNTIDYIFVKERKIPLHSRNLIITGKNGVGKTQFLKALEIELRPDYIHNDEKEYLRQEIKKLLKISIINFSESLNINEDFLEKINSVNEQNLTENVFIERIYEIKRFFNFNLKKFNEKKSSYFKHIPIAELHKHLDPKNSSSIKEIYFYFNNSSHLENHIDELNKNIRTFCSYKTIPGYTKFKKNLILEFTNNKQPEIYTFGATRILESNSENNLEKFLIKQKKEFNKLIEYKNINKKLNYTNEIERWLRKVEQDLKEILEDTSIELSFTKNGNQVLIIQKDQNSAFSFDSLSSGFKAIFNVYTNLLMCAQSKKIEPEELSGIVIIDEIDVHLHISLQKKVLPFLIKAFPKIQFIVSTHSPFVITSTNNNTVVYDISSGEFFEEDLSQYSYESVIKGLFHVNPISSETKESIEILKKLLNEDQTNYENIRSIIKDLIQLEKK